MRRTPPASRDGLSLATREAAEAAARRAGLTLEEWIAANLAQEPGEDRWSAPSALTADDQNRLLSALSDALSGMTQRLDSIERKVGPGSEPLAARAAAVVPAGRAPGGELQARHAAIEAALVRLRQQIAADLVPPPSSVHDDQAPLALRSDIAPSASRRDTPRAKAGAWAPAIASIRAEIERVHAALNGLATRDEVTTLERLIRHLGEHLKESGRGDAGAVAASLDGLRAKIDHLSDEVAADIHGRLAGEIDGLMRKVDVVAASGLDRGLTEELARQIADMRQALSELAEPRSVERLAQEVAKLSLQVADLNSRQVAARDFAALQATMEGLRSAFETTQRKGGEVPHQLEHLKQRLDQLIDRPGPSTLDSVNGQVEQIGNQLQELMSRVPTGTDTVMAEIERLSGRVDRFDEVLRQAGRGGQGSTEAILQAIHAKLERFGASAEKLESLERTVVELAGKLGRNGADPALAALQRAMNDLLAQVGHLREDAATIAERAARAVLKDAQGAGQKAPSGAGLTDIEALQQGFADLKAFQAATDRKTQQTLQAVHNALETLLMRPPGPAREGLARPVGTPASAGEPASPAVRMEAAVRKLHAAAMAQTKAVPSGLESGRPRGPSASVPSDDVLLEPGTPRPAPASRPADLAGSAAPDTGSVRASFIAAARRAAQAAASEVGAASIDFSPSGFDAAGAAAEPTRLQRLRQALLAHRRPSSPA